MLCLRDVTEKSKKYQIVLLYLKDLAQIMWNKNHVWSTEDHSRNQDNLFWI